MAASNAEKTPESTGCVTYWYGDAARYTGKSEILYGKCFYELILLEGHRKGETVVTSQAPR